MNESLGALIGDAINNLKSSQSKVKVLIFPNKWFFFFARFFKHRTVCPAATLFSS